MNIYKHVEKSKWKLPDSNSNNNFYFVVCSRIQRERLLAIAEWKVGQTFSPQNNLKLDKIAKKNRNKNNLHRPEGINKVRNVCENLLNSRENVEFLHGAACILTQTGKYDPFSGKMQPTKTDFRCVIMLHLAWNDFKVVMNSKN